MCEQPQINEDELKSWDIYHTVFLYDEFGSQPELEMWDRAQRLLSPPLTSGFNSFDPDETYIISVNGTDNSSIAGRANFEYLMEQYGELAGVYELGYQDGSSIGFDARIINSDQAHEFLECCGCMESDAVISNEVYERVKQEAIQEAIDNWFEQELIECLMDLHGIEFDAYCCVFPRDVLSTAMEVAQQEWVEQSDGTIYLDPDKVAPHIEMAKLKEHIGFKQPKDDFLHVINKILAANIPPDWEIDEQWDSVTVKTVIKFDERSLTIISDHVQ